MAAKKIIEITVQREVSDDEIKLVQMIADNMTAKAISEKTGIRKRTVETQIATLRRKYFTRSPVGLVMLFTRNKLIS